MILTRHIMKCINIFLIVFTFLFSSITIASKLRATESNEFSEANSKIIYLKLGYEYLLDENYEEALNSLKISINCLDHQIDNSSVEFLLHFGLIIANDNLNLVAERNVSMDKLINCIHDLNQINREFS